MAAEIALAKDTMFRDAIRKVVQVKCQIVDVYYTSFPETTRIVGDVEIMKYIWTGLDCTGHRIESSGFDLWERLSILTKRNVFLFYFYRPFLSI